MKKVAPWLLAGILIALIAAGLVWWAALERPEADGVVDPGPALPAAVDYEFVWPEGANRGIDIPSEILIPATGERLPLYGLGDMVSEPGENKVGFLHRVRQEMLEFSNRQTYEACALICNDDNGTYSVRMITVNAVGHCAIAPLCMPGHRTMQQTIHSHCPSRAQFRATYADEVLSGGRMRAGRFFGRCDPNRFSATDFEGWRPGWLAAPRELLRHDGPKRVTRH